MENLKKISAEELHAFIDGELDHPCRENIEANLRSDPELASVVAAFRADKAYVGSLFGPLIGRPVPAEWLDMIKERTQNRWNLPSTKNLAALAAAIVLTIAGAATYRELSSPKPDDIIEEALAVRDNAVAPLTVVDGNTLRNAVARNTILTAALNTQTKVPDLAGMGYHLAGIQIYGGVPGGKAIELTYRAGDNRMLTLYVRHSNGTPRFDQFRKNGIRVCIWQDDVIGTVVAGPMSAPEMQRVASVAYSGF